jgi:hypothetical protein
MTSPIVRTSQRALTLFAVVAGLGVAPTTLALAWAPNQGVDQCVDGDCPEPDCPDGEKCVIQCVDQECPDTGDQGEDTGQQDTGKDTGEQDTGKDDGGQDGGGKPDTPR